MAVYSAQGCAATGAQASFFARFVLYCTQKEEYRGKGEGTMEYLLENEFLQAAVSSQGAELVSIRDKAAGR